MSSKTILFFDATNPDSDSLREALHRGIQEACSSGLKVKDLLAAFPIEAAIRFCDALESAQEEREAEELMLSEWEPSEEDVQ